MTTTARSHGMVCVELGAIADQHYVDHRDGTVSVAAVGGGAGGFSVLLHGTPDELDTWATELRMHARRAARQLTEHKAS